MAATTIRTTTKKKAAKKPAKAARKADAMPASQRIDEAFAALRDWRGERLAEIRKLIHEVDPDVVVVGSHGRGFLGRVLIGSVSEYVVRHCTAPVLVVRHDGASEAEPILPEGDTAAEAAGIE